MNTFNYSILNKKYSKEWYRLVAAREAIAHMNPWRAVKSMKGVALEKYHAMEHEYPSKVDIIKQYGYDGKQLHHLIRVQEFLYSFLQDKPYSECLRPTNPEYLKLVKQQGFYTLEEARDIANKTIANVVEVSDNFCNTHQDQEDTKVRELLEDVQYEIMKIAVQDELGG